MHPTLCVTPVRPRAAPAAPCQACVTAVFGLGPLGRLPLPATLSNLHVKAVARATLGPLLPEPPYAARASLTLLQPPVVGFSLGPGSVSGRGGGGGGGLLQPRLDLMSLPGVAWLANTIVKVRSLVGPAGHAGSWAPGPAEG